MSLFNRINRIAFVGWNPFQFRHIKNIAKLIPGSIFLVEDRKNGNLSYFSESFFENYNNPVVVINKGEIYKFDGEFDAIVSQVVFPGIQKIEKTKIVMIQYGYAKEPHNYGIWRSLADLNITYGPYASIKIGHYTPIAECGNPEADDWEDPIFHKISKEKFSKNLDPMKKTILYAPTWGDLSSIELYFDKIIALNNKYNVIVKLHHNTDIIEDREITLKNNQNINIYGASENIYSLLSVADIVISDYSGAIFDAYYCKKPIILLDTPNAEKSKKIDKESIELTKRDEIGSIARCPEDLENFSELYNKSLKKVRGELFNVLFSKSYGYNAKKAAIAILEASKGKYNLSEVQKYVREMVKKVNYKEFK